MTTAATGVEIHGPMLERFDEVLTPQALEFIGHLHREFNPTREALLEPWPRSQGEQDAHDWRTTKYARFARSSARPG
jgi:malate synthase